METSRVAAFAELAHGALMSLGLGELIVIAGVIVSVFSAARMSAMGNALGKFVYSFKRAARGADLIDVSPGRGRSNDRLGPSGAPKA